MNQANDGDDENETILASLNDVGSRKAIGYLPLRTITEVLKLDLKELKERFESLGLGVKIYGPDNTCIKSGAFFVYHFEQIKTVIDQHRERLTIASIVHEVDSLVDSLATTWYTDDHSMKPLIRVLFGEQSALTYSRSQPSTK